VRPDLTWRDIQHLCVNTARVVNPSDPEWEYTANGRLYNYKYGFGKLDAYDFVTAAKDWQVVKPQAWLELPAVQLGDGTMDTEGRMEGGEPIVPGGVASSLVITEKMLEEANFENLEHVTVNVWISHSVRGHVEVELVSPNGNRSVLAKKRSRDRDQNGFMGWKFMTVKHWCVDMFYPTMSGSI
jgi:kexin